MTSPRPSSSVYSVWQLLGFVPEISAASRLGLRPLPSSSDPQWAEVAVSFAWAAFVGLLLIPVLVHPCAVEDEARSGDALDVYEDVCGSDGVDGFAGDDFEDENGVLGVGAGVDRGDEVEASDADGGASAYDGALSGPVGSSSFPSYDPWCSYSHLTCLQDDESMLPLTSFLLLSALEELVVKHKDY